MPGKRTDQIQVSCLLDGNDSAWDSFVKKQPYATFFHLSGWKTVIEQGVGHRCHYLQAWLSGEIIGILPLTEVRSRLFGHSLISNGFCVYGGPVAETAAAQQALDAAALDLGKELGVDRIEYRLRHRLHAEWPCNDRLYATFRKEIDADPEKNMLAIPRKQRAMVRKGIKLGLEGQLDDGTQRFFPLYAESLRNLGTPVMSRKYFDCLTAVFADSCSIVTVVRDGEALSSVLSFFFRDEVLPYYGGGKSTARDHAANDFMYWEVMRRAAEAGVRIFDFGRSKAGTGSFSFKKHWGFQPEALHYEHKLLRVAEVPEINPLNPKYAVMVATWKRLPLVVANALGPLVARHLA